MKIPYDEKNNIVPCPKEENPVDLRICKACRWLGWVSGGKVTCRWTLEKEEFSKGERYYEISI